MIQKRTLFVDTGPLGLITNPKKPPLTVDALRWVSDHLRAGNAIMVPSIADFEVRRELVRLGKTKSVGTLNNWNSLPSDRYVSLTDSALRRAADLWAQSRNLGTPTADAKELDCDVLIAAQVLEYQAIHGLASSAIILATVNIGHLSRFLAADLWQNIRP